MARVVGRLVPVEAGVKAWAESVAEIVSRAPGGVFLELPSAPVYPLLRIVGVVGGRRDRGEAPLYHPVVQLDAWGGTRAAAASLAYAAAQAADDIRGPTPAGDTVILLAALVVRLPQFLPDPESGRARYSTDVQFTLRSAT